MIINAVKTRCPVLWDFWDDRYDPKIRQSRIASQDPELFRILERDETTANGVSTIMSDGHDEILVLDVGYLNLRNVLYVDVVQVIHDFNSFKSVSEDKMRRIWENIIHSMNHYESEELKAEKLEEMDSQEAKRYWHDFGLKMLVKPSHEQASSMDGHSYCGTYAQSVQQMSLFTRPLPPPPGFEGNLPHLPRASINRDQDTTTRRPSCPQPDNRPISPVPPLTQTAQPFSMFTISLPQPATLPAPCTQRSKRNNQPTPPRPTFSQTAQPISLFTVLLPRQGNRPLSFTPTPSSSQAALPPLILSRPSWPPVSLQEQVLESVSAETSPTPFPRLRTHRRLWDPPSARDGFTLRTRRGDLRVPRED